MRQHLDGVVFAAWTEQGLSEETKVPTEKDSYNWDKKARLRMADPEGEQIPYLRKLRESGDLQGPSPPSLLPGAP